jgi:hypothetical protein
MRYAVRNRTIHVQIHTATRVVLKRDYAFVIMSISDLA